MAGSKKQLIYIGGGESFVDRADFLEQLKTKPLRHLPQENNLTIEKSWKESLSENLGQEWEIIIPPMPNRDNAKYDEWKTWFERHFDYLSDGAVLIGCSLGAMFLGRYLTEESLPFTPGAIFLLAAGVPLPEEENKDYGDFLIDLSAVSAITDTHKNVVIMHSRDDFVVPYSHGEKLAEALPEAEFITFEDKNHFLIEEFPELITKIKALS